MANVGEEQVSARSPFSSGLVYINTWINLLVVSLGFLCLLQGNVVSL